MLLKFLAVAFIINVSSTPVILSDTRDLVESSIAGHNAQSDAVLYSTEKAVAAQAANMNAFKAKSLETGESIHSLAPKYLKFTEQQRIQHFLNLHEPQAQSEQGLHVSPIDKITLEMAAADNYDLLAAMVLELPDPEASLDMQFAFEICLDEKGVAVLKLLYRDPRFKMPKIDVGIYLQSAMRSNNLEFFKALFELGIVSGESVGKMITNYSADYYAPAISLNDTSILQFLLADNSYWPANYGFETAVSNAIRRGNTESALLLLDDKRFTRAIVGKESRLFLSAVLSSNAVLAERLLKLPSMRKHEDDEFYESAALEGGKINFPMIKMLVKHRLNRTPANELVSKYLSAQVEPNKIKEVLDDTATAKMRFTSKILVLAINNGHRDAYSTLLSYSKFRTSSMLKAAIRAAKKSGNDDAINLIEQVMAAEKAERQKHGWRSWKLTQRIRNLYRRLFGSRKASS